MGVPVGVAMRLIVGIHAFLYSVAIEELALFVAPVPVEGTRPTMGV